MELGLSTSALGLHALPERLGIFAEAGVTLLEIHRYTLDEFDFGDPVNSEQLLRLEPYRHVVR